MAALNFPNVPVVNQIFYGSNGAAYRWDGHVWILIVGPTEGAGSVPPGGTAGQVLVKNSAADWDVSWAAADQGAPWIPDYLQETLKINPSVAKASDTQAIYGIEFGDYFTNPTRGRVFGWDSGLELSWNFAWRHNIEGARDDYSRPSITLDFSTGITPSNPTGLPFLFSGSYSPIGGSTAEGTWVTPFAISMQQQGPLADAGHYTEFALGIPDTPVKTRIGTYVSGDAELITNYGAGVADDPTKPSWAFDIGANQNDVRGAAGFSYRPANTPSDNASWIELFDIFPEGNIRMYGPTATKASGTTWANPSDPRLKDDVEPYPHGLQEILQLTPIRYTLNGLAGTPKGAKASGFDAEAVRAILPDCVSVQRQKLHPDDPAETDVLALDIHGILIALVNAVKELAGKVAPA